MSKQTVLMIDNQSIMIDRRIILEAQTLIQRGYHVILATRGSREKPPLSYERGIEIRRFPITSDRQQEKDLYAFETNIAKLSDWMLYPENSDLKETIHQRFAYLPKWVQSTLYCLSHPPAFAAAIARRVPTLKLRFGKLFEPICYSLLLRPSYLMPYFIVYQTVLKRKINPTLPTSMETIFETQLFDYATSIQPDYVHAHDLPNLELGIKIAKHHNVPLIYDAHELYPHQFFAQKSHQSNFAELEKRLIDNADAVITINQQCEDVLRQAYPAIKDIVLLSNATEAPAHFDPTQKNRLWHQKFHLSPSIKVMVFQGGINPARHVDHLIHALAKVPDHIHVGFITFKRDIPYYKALTDELGISHRVHYIMEIPWDEVNDWLAAADVGIMPYQASNYNTQISSPNKLFEFVIAGLPIIASSELVNVKKAIDDHHIGVYRLLREHDSYIEAILDMFDESKGGPERFRPNVLAVRHLYTWDNEAPRLLNLYQRLSKTNDAITC